MRCGFFNYFEAMLRSPQKKSFDYVTYIFSLFTAAVSVYFGIAALNPVAFFAAFLAGFIYMLSALASRYFNITPNLVSQLPLSPKRSLAYRFLSILLLYVLSVIALVVFFTAITLITGGIILLIEGASAEVSPDVVESGAEELDILMPMGVYGGIFSAVYVLFMYGMGMTVGFIKNHKVEIITVISLGVAVLLGMILTGNPFIAESYDKMAVPWLCTVFCCLAAVAALGTAIYLGIKQYFKKY